MSKLALTSLILALLIASPAIAQQRANQVANAPQSRNGLPPCTMDSFVYEAGEHKEHIYGDEGSDGPPPYYGFDTVHRINEGILGQRDAGLTTGHGSYLPDAWGADEFLAPPGEQSLSGANGGNRQTNGAAASLDKADQAEANDTTTGAQSGQNIPPPPGPGYQAAYDHGMFVGYYSPAEVALAQTDFPAAWQSFVSSSRYIGGEGLALSAQYEMDPGSMTQAQLDELTAMAMFD